MSIKGISVQELRNQNMATFKDYVDWLIEHKQDWPRNPQNGQISLLGIEKAIKALFKKRFDRKYLQAPTAGEDSTFFDRFTSAQQQVRQTLIDAGIEQLAGKPAKEKLTVDEKALRDAQRQINKLQEELRGARANEERLQLQVASLERRLEQYDLISGIGLDEGKTVIPASRRADSRAKGHRQQLGPAQS